MQQHGPKERARHNVSAFDVKCVRVPKDQHRTAFAKFLHPFPHLVALSHAGERSHGDSLDRRIAEHDLRQPSSDCFNQWLNQSSRCNARRMAVHF